MSTPFPLADLLGEPRPITLAGRTFLLAPLRVRDLASLGAFAMRGDGPDPIEAAGLIPDDAPAEVRSAAMRAAQSFADAPPPDVGSQAYREATANGDGLAWLAFVALRRHDPEFTHRAACELVAAMAVEDPAGFARLNRRAFGVHPARAFASLLDTDDDGKPVDWPRLIDRLSEARGWSYETIADMPLPAFWNALRKGEAIGVEYRPRKGESWSALRARVKAFLGLD